MTKFNPDKIASALKQLAAARKSNKQRAKRQALTKNERALILLKTNGKCHICGIELNGKFEADHVISHAGGGRHDAENYLPSCKLCNNYRWHYGAEEIQWILKLGVYAKTQIVKDTVLGNAIVEGIKKQETQRIKRKKS